MTVDKQVLASWTDTELADVLREWAIEGAVYVQELERRQCEVKISVQSVGIRHLGTNHDVIRIEIERCVKL